MMLAVSTDTEPLSIAALWRRHGAELVRFATVLVGPTDAYDVAADAFLAAAPAALRPDVANQRAYLFRAVANQAHSQRRSRTRRWRRDLAAVGPSSTSSPDDYSDVRRAVAGLTPAQRAVVYCAYWEDMPERAIASFLGISPGSVHKSLARAKSALRKALS